MQSRTSFFLIRVLPFIVVLGGVGVVIGLFLFSDNHIVSDTVRTSIHMNSYDFDVRVAQNAKDRQQGLSGSSLMENEGMLFVFESPDYHSLWMKDMLVSLDMIWLDALGVVVHILENVHPETFPTIFTPKEKALYVLELPAGAIDRVGVKIGDKIEIPTSF
ncbi:MAG: DUF192 domain-containing protein [Candidatus Pacebacteria bacterium]|nr:DUF192 domain-containing protein [Candidatus Paceibacterota bacterium]